MCTAHIIQSVKETMIDRRTMLNCGLTGAVAMAASGTANGAQAQEPQQPQISPTLPIQLGEIIDLTHTLSPEFPTFDDGPGIKHEQLFNLKDDGFNLFEITINEHSGTHVDAPLHYSADGKSVDELELSDLFAPLAIVDIREKADADRDAELTPDDLRKWIRSNGPLPERCCVAMNSGWATKAANEADFIGWDDKGAMHFPGFHIEATIMLLEESSAVAIGVDTLSLDHGPSTDFATHHVWLSAGRYGVECLANLDAVPNVGATIIVGAPKHKGGTGGPARVFAAI